MLAHGEAVETVPTIGLNVKVFKKGQVAMKCWDIGGQEQYRSEWSRYTKGCDVVLYVVDTASTFFHVHLFSSYMIHHIVEFILAVFS